MSSLSIKIGAVLDASFAKTVAGSTKHLSRLGDTIEQLKKSMEPASQFKKLSNEVEAAEKSWKDAKKEAKDLAKEMKKTEKPSRTLTAQLNKANASVVKARAGYLKKKEALRAFNEEVRKSGRDIQSLIGNHAKLESSLSRVRSQYKMLNSVVQAHGRAKARRSVFRSEMLDTAALGMTLVAPIKVGIDFESFMADVKKVVDFDNDEEAKEFANNLKKMSRKIPLSAAELAQIAASGGQLGIEKKELLEFTEIVAKMSTAFDMTAEEAGDAIAKLANVFGIKVKDMTDKGDAFNYLSDNSAAKAKDMIPVVNRMGGVAKQFGLSIEQTSALANAFLSLGVPVSKAGTAGVALLTELQMADQQDEAFHEALEEIGTSAEEIKQGIKDDPMGTLLKVLELLEKVDPQERAGILVKLFGKQFQDEIALLVGGLGKLKKNMELLADKKRQGSMQREFDNRASTTANKLQLLKNSIAEVGMNLGSVMLPALKSIAEWLQEKAEGIALLVEEYPTVTAVIMYTIAALISLKIAIVVCGYGFSFLAGAVFGFAAKAFTVFSFLSTYAIPAVITGLSFLKATALSLATSALPAVTAGVRFLTAAIVSNPIGAVITAIVAGAILIISNWQKVKDFFSSIWEYIKSIIKPIGEAFSWIGNTVSSIFGKVSENSPLKEFEKRESIAEIKTVHTPLKTSIPSNENSLLNNSAIKEMSERSGNNVRVKSLIEEKKSIEDNQVDKVFEKNICEKKESKICNQTFHQTFNINVKAEPHQDTRSIADAVIERFREQARGALFDIVEEVH